MTRLLQTILYISVAGCLLMVTMLAADPSGTAFAGPGPEPLAPTTTCKSDSQCKQGCVITAGGTCSDGTPADPPCKTDQSSCQDCVCQANAGKTACECKL